MARGIANGEPVVSQAATEEYRANHERALGERPQGVRGRWVWDEQAKTLVRAEDYRPPPVKCGTEIMSDRVYEGATFDDGERVRDLGSRSKRRAFQRETGLADASDYSPEYLAKAAKARESAAERRIDASAEAAVRKLYAQRKWRE